MACSVLSGLYWILSPSTLTAAQSPALRELEEFPEVGRGGGRRVAAARAERQTDWQEPVSRAEEVQVPRTIAIKGEMMGKLPTQLLGQVHRQMPFPH